MNNIDNIDNTRLLNIENKLISIENKLDYIINKIDSKVVKSCDNIDRHITFIEKVYDIVKYPLFFIINKINMISNIKKKIFVYNI